MRTLPVALRAYLWAIYAAAIAVVAIEVARAPAHLASGALLTQAAVFCLVAYACEFTEVRIAPGLAQTVVTTAHIATILLFPPPAPVVIALVAASAASLRDRDLPLFKRAFNVAHAVLIVGVNSAVFARTIGGAGPLTPREVASLFPSAVLLLGLYYALDVGLYLGVRAIPARVAIWTLWASTYPSTLLPELAASSIGILVAVTWRLWPALIALFIVPVIALNLTFRAIAAADRRTDGLRHVLAIAEKMEIKRWDPSELMRQVAAAARAVAEAETATVYMLDPDDTSRFERIAIVPRDADSCGPSHIPVAATATRTDADEGRHVRPARDRMGDLFAVPGARVVVLPIEAEPGSDALILLSGVPAHVESVTRDTLTILSAAAASAWRNVLAHQHVRAQAAEDGLTGLLNHRTFHLSLENEVVRAQRSARVLSLIMVDVDNFGQINNAHGHQAGDAVLRAVAEMLRAASRTSDLAARYGGDEFAIILPEATTEDALDVAERARAAIASLRILHEGRAIKVDCSVGVATLPMHADAPADLIRAADQAVYLAKHAGKGRVGRPEDRLMDQGQDVAGLAAQLEHANLAMVEALAAAVDAKDAYTRGHSRRVSDYSGAIAYELGLPPEDVTRIRRAALLHDVGKIGIPDAILTKPGPLDQGERAIMEKHPEIGETVLASVPYLAEILPAVRHHHERRDGRGYPDGLRGEAIPRDAAIIAVADAFDAMTTNRTYRGTLSPEEARRRLREGAGTQFFPHIVTAFETAIDSGVAPRPPVSPHAAH